MTWTNRFYLFRLSKHFCCLNNNFNIYCKTLIFTWNCWIMTVCFIFTGKQSQHNNVQFHILSYYKTVVKPINASTDDFILCLLWLPPTICSKSNEWNGEEKENWDNSSDDRRHAVRLSQHTKPMQTQQRNSNRTPHQNVWKKIMIKIYKNCQNM